MQALGQSDRRVHAVNTGDALSVGYSFRRGNCLKIGEDAYIIISPIGRGAVGDVYKVKNLRTGEHFAMKHLYYRFTNTDPEKYYRKIRLLAAHANPHHCFVWPKAIEYDDQTNSFCYIMPLVSKDYMPLARAINDRKLLTMEQRIHICKQLAEAFTELRKLKWVYGDCSAKNILFKKSRGRAKPDVLIIDTDTITVENAPFGLEGTGCYRAPEIFLGKNPTLNSDAHALAAVMFHLLIGCNPLDGTKTRQDRFTEDAVLQHYGKDPVYIFDPCGRNKPLATVLGSRLKQLPLGLRVYFQLMFSQDRLTGKTARPGPDVLLQYISK